MSSCSRARLHKIREDHDGSSIQATNSEQQSALQLGRRAPYNYSSPVVPSSDFQIRNRLLSKMGAKVID